MTAPPKEIRGLLLVLSGPTGSGKTTLCDRLIATHAGIERIVTCTTRPPREGEQNGVDYHFLGNAEFDEALAAEEFLEWAQVHGARYGTKKTAVFSRLARGIDLVVNVDVQGARAYRQAFASHSSLRDRLVSVFVLPQNMETIFDRILTRGKETKEQMDRRMKTAIHEMGEWPRYDYCILSDSKEADYARLESIWRAEKCRVTRLLEAIRAAGSNPAFGKR